MQRVDIRLGHRDFFCPITGQTIVSLGRSNPSPATQFIYVHDDRVFEFCQDDLQSHFAHALAMAERPGTLQTVFELFLEEVDQAGLVVFSIMTLGSTLDIGIDMNYVAENSH